MLHLTMRHNHPLLPLIPLLHHNPHSIPLSPSHNLLLILNNNTSRTTKRGAAITTSAPGEIITGSDIASLHAGEYPAAAEEGLDAAPEETLGRR